MVTLPFHLVNAGRGEAIEYCRQRGIGVVAMNPLGGGRLARPVPVLVKLAGELGFGSPVEAALRFVAHWPGITTALNGITLAEHATEGVAAVAAGPIPADAQESLQQRLGEIYQSVHPRHLCSACGYCGQCPQGILIPKVLEAWTGMQIPSMAEQAGADARAHVEADEEGWDPSVCTACGECEAKCPNKIPVSELMAAAADAWPR